MKTDGMGLHQLFRYTNKKQDLSCLQDFLSSMTHVHLSTMNGMFRIFHFTAFLHYSLCMLAVLDVGQLWLESSRTSSEEVCQLNAKGLACSRISIQFFKLFIGPGGVSLITFVVSYNRDIIFFSSLMKIFFCKANHYLVKGISDLSLCLDK